MRHSANDPADRESVADGAELRRASSNAAEQLRERGILVVGDESSEELAQLLEHVERFERARAAHGGDSFTNSLDSAEPDDPRLVLPRRQEDESAHDYLRRLEAAISRVRYAD